MGQTPRLVAPLNKRRRRVAVREALEDVDVLFATPRAAGLSSKASKGEQLAAQLPSPRRATLAVDGAEARALVEGAGL